MHIFLLALIAGAGLMVDQLLSGRVIAADDARAREIQIDGPEGPLKGRFVPAAGQKAAVIIIPGSGPVDRDGNNPPVFYSNTYKMLADGLAEAGISSLRIDKRGMFSSANAVAVANRTRIEDYAEDVRNWSEQLRSETGLTCNWLLGHSEGALVALKTLESGQEGICGALLVAAPGRKISSLLREQLEANPANASILEEANTIIDRLETGQLTPASDINPALQGLFAPAFQGYMVDLFTHDPADLFASYSGPALILQGLRDIQVTETDARILHERRPDADLRLLPDTNHMLKPVEEEGFAANFAAYNAPHLPLATGVVPALADFMLIER
jgi:pimeloyl-ACP methyl ester carboxylesterase